MPFSPSRSLIALALGLVVAPFSAGAQVEGSPNEFTQQGVLIVNFALDSGTDAKLSRRAAEAVRARVARLTNKREADIIDDRKIDLLLEQSERNREVPFTLQDIRHTSTFFRVDEFLWVTVSASGNRFSLSGDLVLKRDERIRQPLPIVNASTLDAAAERFANAIVAARLQLAPARRCENAMRENNGPRALSTSREGVRIYPRSTIARTCLVRALRFTRSPAAEVLQTANDVLAIDPNSSHAMEAAAISLDALKRRDEAADAWLRLAATDTTNAELALQVSTALFYGGNAKRATEYINAKVRANPDNVPLHAIKAQIAYNNKDWSGYLESAEVLRVRDSTSVKTPAFYIALGMAYTEMKQPVKAIRTLSEAVLTFPDDVKLFSLYSQLVRTEADTVVRRGLTQFPTSPDLLALNARDLRSRGKFQESLDAIKVAVSVDSTMRQAYLMMAQLELQMARPDSAIEVLKRGLERGEDSTLVAQFALGEGNTLYRTASAAKTQPSFQSALRMLSFADSVKSSPQSKFLVGAAALGFAQTVINAAAADTDSTTACVSTEEGMKLMAMSRSGLESGSGLYAEQAKASMEFLARLEEFVQQSLQKRCTK